VNLAKLLVDSYDALSLHYVLNCYVRLLGMVAHLLVVLTRRPMRAGPPRNHILIEATNQIRKITKTTINT
jgi:hypothetical protein